MTRWREEDLSPDIRRRIADDPTRRPAVAHSPNLPSQNAKYWNKIVFVDGERFHSKLEAGHYEQLKLAKATGLIWTFLRQVPFHLGGGVKHVVDFEILFRGREPLFVDSKGFDVKAGRDKRKLVRALYGVEIRIWSQHEIVL